MSSASVAATSSSVMSAAAAASASAAAAASVSAAAAAQVSAYEVEFLATWSELVSPAINFLMIGATMGAVLFVMLLALLFFSTDSMRRKPVFILNVLAILTGMTTAIINMYEEVHTLKYPTGVINTHVALAMGCFTAITPTLVEAILILRLYSVYPPSSTARVTFVLIIGIPVLVVIGRMANAIVYLVNYAKTVQQLTSGAASGNILMTSNLPCVRIEWSLQLFNNLYCSSLFLFKVYQQGSLSHGPVSLSQRLKTLFWISVSNFVFPLILSVVQLAIYANNSAHYVTALYVEQVNIQFTIIGVVFATVWVAEGQWADTRRQETLGRTTQLSTLPTTSITSSPSRKLWNGVAKDEKTAGVVDIQWRREIISTVDPAPFVHYESSLQPVRIPDSDPY